MFSITNALLKAATTPSPKCVVEVEIIDPEAVERRRQQQAVKHAQYNRDLAAALSRVESEEDVRPIVAVEERNDRRRMMCVIISVALLMVAILALGLGLGLGLKKSPAEVKAIDVMTVKNFQLLTDSEVEDFVNTADARYGIYNGLSESQLQDARQLKRQALTGETSALNVVYVRTDYCIAVKEEILNPGTSMDGYMVTRFKVATRYTRYNPTGTVHCRYVLYAYPTW